MNIDKKYLFILLPFICFAAGYLLSSFIIGNKTYATPKLVGLSLYDAIKLTSPHQMNIRIVSEKENAHIPPNTILTQKPNPGRLIKTHQPILISISKMPADAIAPSFLQQSRSVIEKSCKDLHIKFKSYNFEYPLPAETCIAQLPQADQPIKDKKMILYFAKNKTNLFIMPDLVHQPLENAINFLKTFNTKTSIFQNACKIESPHFPSNGMIIAQKPLAGSLVSFDSPLTIQLEIAP
ncbi:PASTA domain-containing protein [Candidatus Dependentiae bacterium]|nr:PASTA domain-containing protein [Candidatus Dependentiae bacterium]